MKLLKGLLLTLSLFVIFSCATTEKNLDTETMETEQNITSEPDKKMVEVEVEEKVYFPTKEIVYYGDGQIDTITTYSYNENFDLLTKIETNEQGEALESKTYIYVDGLLVRINNLGFGNELNSYITFDYNVDGNIIKDSLYDKKEVIQSVNEYKYNNGNIVNWKTLGPSNGVLAVTTYNYDEMGNNTLVELRDSGNSIDGTFEKTYKNNMIVEDKILDSKGKVEKSTKYNYEGDNLIEKVYFDNKNKVKRSESFEYTNSLPVPSKINQHYKSGALEAYTEVEYGTKVIKSTVWVEEE